MSSNNTSLIALSLTTLAASKPASVEIMVITVINSILCICTLYLIIKRKFLSASLMVNVIISILATDMLLSLFLLQDHVQHFYHEMLMIPEIWPTFMCHIYSNVQIIFSMNTQISLCIVSVDRLATVTCPLFYVENSSVGTCLFRICKFLPYALFLFSTVIYFISFFDDYSNLQPYLPICLARSSMGLYYWEFSSNGLLATNFITVTAYTLILLYLTIKILRRKFTVTSDEIQNIPDDAHFNKQLTKIFGFNALIYASTNFLNFLLTKILQFDSRIKILIALYSGPLSIINGSTLFFMFLLFSDEFRSHLKRMFGL